MNEISIEEGALRNAVQSAVEREAHKVLRELLDDGVEFEAVRNCVLVWAMKTRGIGFVRGDVWHVTRTNSGEMGMKILNANGDKFIFRSFHELLQWLFEQPELETISE